jgi:hypothetical protein
MVLGVFITRVLGEFMYPVLIYIAMVLKHSKKSNNCPEKKTWVLCQFFGEVFKITGSDGSLILKISTTKSNTVI